VAPLTVIQHARSPSSEDSTHLAEREGKKKENEKRQGIERGGASENDAANAGVQAAAAGRNESGEKAEWREEGPVSGTMQEKVRGTKCSDEKQGGGVGGLKRATRLSWSNCGLDCSSVEGGSLEGW